MANKSTVTSRAKTNEKGIFRQAGEIIGSIGFHIVNGKDKVVGAVSDEYNIVKRAIKKKLAKKKTTSGSKTKKVSKKASPKKTAKKSVHKVKKITKKVSPVKKKG